MLFYCSGEFSIKLYYLNETKKILIEFQFFYFHLNQLFYNTDNELLAILMSQGLKLS